MITFLLNKAIYNHLNAKCKDPRLNRLFAVVMIAGSQFKVTTEDVITVRNSFYPTIGDKIRLEKVLLVGSSDFTVIGKPLLRFLLNSCYLFYLIFN